MVMHVHPLAVPDDVRASFGGRLLESGEPDYDEVRRLHNGMIDKHPALIAQCWSKQILNCSHSLLPSF